MLDKTFKIIWHAEIHAPDDEEAVLMAFHALLFDPRAGIFKVIYEDNSEKYIYIEDIMRKGQLNMRKNDDPLH